jgi:serine/threonine-protein kinase HipA
VAETAALAEVWLWGRFVGAVAEDAAGVVTFEYDPAFARSGLEISPLKLPLSLAGPVTFPELARVEAFGGLPGVLADALPDRFGNAVIRAFFARRGTPAAALSPVQKLLYVGARAMGALEFRPPIRLRTRAEETALEVAGLVRQARRIVEGQTRVAVPEIMRIGASAGGARPKALVLWNRAGGVIRSAFARPGAGDEHWIIKFDGVGELDAPDPEPRPWNRIEYAYSRMARAAGIVMPETRLLEERRLAHFMVRRFDRDGDDRLHLHSLGGMQHVDYDQPGAFSYEEFFRTILRLGLDYGVLEEAFRRMVFNIAAVNQDDHVKNIGFLMDAAGRWRLAPAYDLTFARGAGFTRRHQMTLAGKAAGHTAEDVLRAGAALGLRKGGAPVVRQVVEALATWDGFAREAGVPDEHRARIGAAFVRLAA